MKKENYQPKIVLRLLTTISVLIFTVAAYIAFGFFFDVFVQVIPILLLPVLIIPFIWCSPSFKKESAISAIVVILILSIASGVAVGLIATSKPGFGSKPSSGSIDTYTYSKEYMSSNYDINQKTVVKVWVPSNYSNEKIYPVMYILDGDMFFNYAAIKASEQSANNRDMIVVGIGYGYWNSTFARGGIVWQDKKHVRGRWRDFGFQDDTEAGYMPGTIMGGEEKRGKEYCEFLYQVVKDIREKYSVDNLNSTIFGHSLGGGMSAYLLTQYDPAKKENNPFNRFVIVDNGYVEYYSNHYETDFKVAMNNAEGSAFNNLYVYRIWGGSVNPEGEQEQIDLYKQINDENWNNIHNYIWIPEGANHSDTETLGLDQAINLALGLQIQYSNL